ncbi:hypothetical protein Pyn_31439 [Prunus yedoensis var. nudiflora]|uniref:Uncharacterized protein n=1 Tax=Prunus yedoensis var. nudiflora TaxID=2094558 RepID=A0A314ZVH4_PRUYE|nr:hypothetical protein Pyn_31439 [Prunus yedoensis var. nudiflora]
MTSGRISRQRGIRGNMKKSAWLLPILCKCKEKIEDCGEASCQQEKEDDDNENGEMDAFQVKVDVAKSQCASWTTLTLVNFLLWSLGGYDRTLLRLRD